MPASSSTTYDQTPHLMLPPWKVVISNEQNIDTRCEVVFFMDLDLCCI